MISLKEIVVTFGKGTPLETLALKSIDLDIDKGEFVTVIGSNGAGKSTLLNILSGEALADSGTLLIDNEDLTRRTTYSRAGLVARVFQDPLAGTCEQLTIEENLALASARGRHRGLKQALNNTLRSRFREQLERLGLGLEDRLSDQMGLLSGGQRQAVSLLMATLQPAKILLLDEHTAALDPKTAAFVLELSREIIEEQTLTTLMVTHSMRQALDVGFRTIMMHQGRIVFDVRGGEREGLDVPDLLALFEKRQGESLTDDSLLLSK
ncbi:MAG: ABC transporter ATP-binding protein [Sedimenticola sp.]|nr:ABC transporter ATP-binding protein [Sedimenticola sp.]